MKKQYTIQKFVMAHSVTEAIKKSKNLPVHSVFVDNVWLDKNSNANWYTQDIQPIGLNHEK